MKTPNTKHQAPEKHQPSGSKYALIVAILAGALLLLSLRLPLWHMRLEAPQYRDEEALKIAVHPNAMKGDLRELKVLNQYIGVHVPPTLPQFKWLPGVIIAGAVLGVGAAFLRNRSRSRALVVIASGLAMALLFAAIQAQVQMHNIGHKRDHRTILAGMHDFTPPFLGTTKIAQFKVSSRFGAGAWLIGAALTLQMAAAGTCGKVARTQKVFADSLSGQLKLSVNEKRELENSSRHVGGYKAVPT